MTQTLVKGSQADVKYMWPCAATNNVNHLPAHRSPGGMDQISWSISATGYQKEHGPGRVKITRESRGMVVE